MLRTETQAAGGLTVPRLLKMSQRELDELYAQSPAGEVPDGESEGTAIIAPGTIITPIKAKLIHLIAWKGKVFDKKKGRLVNKLLPAGIHAIAAEVYKDKSWSDGKECIAIDYSKTSLVTKWVRDEIRLVAPGMYLGTVFFGKKKTANFVLVFPK